MVKITTVTISNTFRNPLIELLILGKLSRIIAIRLSTISTIIA
jgi:hypothetical protein